MDEVCAVISCLLLSVGTVTAQTAQGERLLPQWLTGIIAVAAFLFLTFVGFLVKRAWCKGPGRKEAIEETGTGNEFIESKGNTYETSLDLVRSKDDENVYDKVTAM